VLFEITHFYGGLPEFRNFLNGFGENFHIQIGFFREKKNGKNGSAHLEFELAGEESVGWCQPTEHAGQLQGQQHQGV
jgi:hypothetical protein